MPHVAKTTLNEDGTLREYSTTVDLEDIELNGVAWSQVMRKPYAGRTGWFERLAALMNIATVCREHGSTL